VTDTTTVITLPGKDLQQPVPGEFESVADGYQRLRHQRADGWGGLNNVLRESVGLRVKVVDS
jgi:hypothetical protein